MGLLRVMMPPKLQLLALLAFAVAMFFLENQIQKLEESRGKLGELKRCSSVGTVSVSHSLLRFRMLWFREEAGRVLCIAERCLVIFNAVYRGHLYRCRVEPLDQSGGSGTLPCC